MSNSLNVPKLKSKVKKIFRSYSGDFFRPKMIFFFIKIIYHALLITVTTNLNIVTKFSLSTKNRHTIITQLVFS